MQWRDNGFYETETGQEIPPLRAFRSRPDEVLLLVLARPPLVDRLLGLRHMRAGAVEFVETHRVWEALVRVHRPAAYAIARRDLDAWRARLLTGRMLEYAPYHDEWELYWRALIWRPRHAIAATMVVVVVPPEALRALDHEADEVAWDPRAELTVMRDYENPTIMYWFASGGVREPSGTQEVSTAVDPERPATMLRHVTETNEWDVVAYSEERFGRRATTMLRMRPATAMYQSMDGFTWYAIDTTGPSWTIHRVDTTAIFLE